MARHGRLITGQWQFPDLWAVLCTQDALGAWPRGLGMDSNENLMAQSWEMHANTHHDLLKGCHPSAW